MSGTILVTGGAGYIGTHTCVELLTAGHDIVVLDNLINANEEGMKRVQELTGREFPFHKVDLCDRAAVEDVFKQYEIISVIHFAGLKAVGESVAKPLYYYQNNITGTLCLLEVMRDHNCFDIVFSSSATVYGDPHTVPITEDFPLQATNPYGRTKLFIEDIIRDLCISDERWSAILLRYFNPVGAHASGCIGENPNGIPNNLMPYVMQVAVGIRDCVNVFGGDYDTPDGTGVRDYIHVVDLALGHLAALKHLPNEKGCRSINLGTGNGYSVLDMIGAAAAASGKKIAHKIADRRPGDIASCYADPKMAQEQLGWRASRDIQTMCNDHWRWQEKNPQGYQAE